MKIESTDQDIRTMLAAGYYRIPRFQRPYSWDRENIQEFWDDIVRDAPPDYFIGSMVVFKDGSQRFGVVDGQQRLTTITILLCVLRNRLAELGHADLAQGTHSLVERRNIDNKAEFVVSTESSYPFFQDHIQKWGTPAVTVNPLKEEQSLKAAFDQLNLLVSDTIKSIDSDPTLSTEKRAEQSKQKVIGIRDALLNLKVIFVKLDDEDDAYVIFETLNTRGKDLSLKDLVKNHITKHLKSTNPQSDEAKIKWEQLLETIEGSSAELATDTFLHHSWLSKYDYRPAKTLFKTLRKEVTPRIAGSFLNALIEDASLYRSIHEIGYGKWSKQEKRIAGALEALMLFRVQQQVPCVLSLLREYRSTHKLKKNHVEGALIAIEKFHFLFTAVTSQRSSGGISSMYASLGRRLHEAKDTQEAVKIIAELKDKLRDRVPKIQEFRALFPEIIFTDNITKQKKLVKYILTCLDKQMPSHATVDYEQMTVEHLVPQSQIGAAGFTDAIVGQLGNLLLVSAELNEKLKNRPFKEKKKLLTAAGFSLPKEIESATDWTEKAIVARTTVLAERAYNEVWRI